MVLYADGPTARVDIEIEAPVADVWRLVTDINVPASFSQEFQRAEWIEGSAALGSRFRGYNKHEVVGEWSVECTITDFADEAVFEWTVGDVANKSAKWRFEVSAVGEGTANLAFEAEMGPGPSGLTPAIERMPEREEDIVARRLGEWEANMRRTAEGIKQLAEASATT